ncbi:uncharacterized protein MELLADRAFT_114599 [Melampsora larici-populina 98AG31]|uniref:Kinetochore protein Nuf2 N-terminal domain-containing protein n=1 Tax=Melampsora larici-populina (strain 98AG31 / pathotype 3-4-7) TaxID=747676 RepID=F4SE35_MELLP|nr:uncharacterized protein MELLADRAFT_114599 [Melampsora larici-populina 98AG31]EGF97091.1 hypothetical protein MELLADRAFT_114599 [Melampsora larici-populina 98AG31]
MSFPTLSPDDIITTFKDFGCPIDLTIDELNTPNPIKVHSIFKWVLSGLCDINRAYLYDAIEEPLLTVHHPTIYKYRLFTGVFKDAIVQLMRCAAIYDFSDRDLLNPTTD